jgi:hypothetical protein
MPGYWTKAGGVRYTLIFLDERRLQDSGVSAEEWKSQLWHVDPFSGFEVTAKHYTKSRRSCGGYTSRETRWSLSWAVH